ncbi:metallophosphoesterase [Amphibacillus sp. Q70]|uniref:metallophosphoesterase n=1 Tax=Amphibacillus sp. Q70 TaxID=3453416 RepID=UPI003F8708C6
MKKFIIITIIFLLLIVKVINDTTAIKVNTVTIPNDKLTTNQKISILQISDVHNRDLEGSFDRLTELDPDLIVLTGDLIDRKTTDLTNTTKLLDQLVTMDRPIYFVSGNHEQESPIFADLKGLLAEYEVIELDNQHMTIEVNGVPINLAGVANASTGHAKLIDALEGVNLTYPTVLLSHSPITPDNEIDLILSGHTHGGQVRLPFIGGLIAPDQGFFPEYDKGIYELDSGATLYIDSGLGTSLLPIRFFNEAQVSIVTIISEE